MIVNNAGCAVYSFVIGCVHTLHDSWKSQLYWMCYMWHHRGHNMRGRSKTDVTNLPSATAAGQQKIVFSSLGIMLLFRKEGFLILFKST